MWPSSCFPDIHQYKLCGLPCISFKCPDGPSEIIQDGVDGFLIENADVMSLSEKINFLIEHNGIRIKMGEEAHKNVLRFSSSDIMPLWKKMFESLL